MHGVTSSFASLFQGLKGSLSLGHKRDEATNSWEETGQSLLVDAVLDADCEKANGILSELSRIEDAIYFWSPLSRGCASEVLSFLGDVHALAGVCWRKVLALEWTEAGAKWLEVKKGFEQPDADYLFSVKYWLAHGYSTLKGFQWKGGELALMQSLLYFGKTDKLMAERSPFGGETALLICVKNGCLRLIEMLLVLDWANVASDLKADTKWHFDDGGKGIRHFAGNSSYENQTAVECMLDAFATEPLHFCASLLKTRFFRLVTAIDLQNLAEGKNRVEKCCVSMYATLRKHLLFKATSNSLIGAVMKTATQCPITARLIVDCPEFKAMSFEDSDEFLEHFGIDSNLLPTFSASIRFPMIEASYDSRELEASGRHMVKKGSAVESSAITPLIPSTDARSKEEETECTCCGCFTMF